MKNCKCKKKFFSMNEIAAIDSGYFYIISDGPYEVRLKSKNTRHFWIITVRDNHVLIFHSHLGDGPYHQHGKASRLETAVRSIVAHDKFQLKKRKKENNDFDYIPPLGDDEYFPC